MHPTPTTPARHPRTTRPRITRLVVTGAVALGLALPLALDVPGGAPPPPRPRRRPPRPRGPSRPPTSARPSAACGTGWASPAAARPTSAPWSGAAAATSSSRERELGRTIRLHRTYYQAHQIKGATRDARADLRAGRMSWMSFKAPLSWGEMARGEGNDWARKLASHLGRVNGPVWLAVHHEPENDGDMRQWTRMQRQIARIIHAETNNVAYSVIYAGWNTFGGDNNTVASKWPGDRHVDVLAIDAYNDYGVSRDGRVGTKTLKLRPYYRKMARWSRKHGTAWAIGETGQSVRGARSTRPGSTARSTACARWAAPDCRTTTPRRTR